MRRFVGVIALAWLGFMASAVEEGENLLLNPDFEEGPVSWSHENHAGQGAISQLIIDTKEAFTGSQSMLVQIDGTGGTWWHIGLNQNVSQVSGYKFKANETYTLAAWMKTEPGKVRMAGLCGGENHDPWATWGFEEFQITDEWVEYHTTWTQPNDDANARIRIFMGHSKQDVWVDHVRFFLGEYVEDDLSEPKAVEPAGKLATAWGTLKTR